MLFIRKGTDNSLRQTIFNKISQKHLDFVLLDPQTLIPVMAVELDDSSHKSSAAKKRDDVKDKALRDAGLKLVRIPSKHAYTSEDFVDVLNVEKQDNADLIEENNVVDSDSNNEVIYVVEQAENGIEDTSDQNSAETVVIESTVVPVCPKCNVEMVKRTASRGANAGQHFWGCPNFPNCREIRSIEVEEE